MISSHHAVAIILAPLIGSFLGVVVDRLPLGLSIGCGRSRCDHCNLQLGPSELVPLLSYAVQRGRCRRCKERLRYFYPIIELAAVLVAASAAFTLDGVVFWVSVGLGWCLLCLAALDLRFLVLPDILTLPLIFAGLVFAYLARPEAFHVHVIGATLGLLTMAGIAWFYRRLRGREGLGLGDAKLFAAAGAWLGWEGLSGVILIAATLAMSVSLAASACGDRLSATSKIAFGPYLAFAIWTSWLLGPIVVA